MPQRDEADGVKFERLRQALAEGEASGFDAEFLMQDLMAELDEEAQAEGLAGT